MKFLRLAFLVPALGLCALRAQDQQQKPPEEIPDFSNLDEYIYQPKSVLNFGYRYITGIKTQFSGRGSIAAPEAIPAGSSVPLARTYHDGAIGLDTRTITNADGTTSPQPADGFTNTWNYTDNSQLNSAGNVAFHVYSADITDSAVHSKNSKGNMGLELSMARDMGNFGKRLSWQVFGGFSVNDIQASTLSLVPATVNTWTDTYLVGATAGGGSLPSAPYTAPSSTTVTNDDGSTTTTDTTTLLGSSPLTQSGKVSRADSTSVTNHWKLHGAYATFRVGPTLIYNITDRLHFSVSIGPALLYAGSTYTVDEVLLPPEGTPIVSTLSSTKDKILIGLYGDATLEYDLTDRTGLYVGTFMQNAGGYSQSDTAQTTSTDASGNPIPAPSTYSTHVQFGNQEGLRTGISFKF